MDPALQTSLLTPPLTAPRRSRFSLRLLLFAFLFLILGAGNIFIGQMRARSYETLIHEYETQTGINQSPQKEKNLQYLEARYGFYRFCILGGKCFLAFAAFFMIMSLLVQPRSVDEDSVDEDSVDEEGATEEEENAHLQA